MVDVLLENRISSIVVIYHPVVMEALQQALELRKVPHVDLTAFFANDNQNSHHKN
jgi:hypothetical protein